MAFDPSFKAITGCISVVSHEKNLYDGDTLPDVLTQIETSQGKAVKNGVCDRGFRGKKQVAETAIILPALPLKRDNRCQRDKKRKRLPQESSD